MANPPDKKKPTPPAAAPKETPKEPPQWLIQAKKYIALAANVLGAIQKSPFIVLPAKFITKLGWKGWLKIATCISCVFLAFAIYKTVPYWKKFWALPYKGSFIDVADSHRKIPDSEELIRYANDLIAPQYMV